MNRMDQMKKINFPKGINKNYFYSSYTGTCARATWVKTMNPNHLNIWDLFLGKLNFILSAINLNDGNGDADDC